MANYIGLQGVFNALAGGGANAVNIYAQEKDRQRRLAFDEKKFDADQAYRKQVLDQDQQRIDHATRTQDFVENKWQHLQDEKRRESVVDLQTRTVGNARARAMEKGYDNLLTAAQAGDAEAFEAFNSGLQNAARYTMNSDVDTELVKTGKDAAGDDIYSVVYTENGKQKTFGQSGNLGMIAKQMTKFNTEIGLPVFLAQKEMAVDYDKDGKALVVNKGKGGPELTPDQQKAVGELDQQLQQSEGEGLQQKLDNPLMPQIQAELEGQKGLAYEGMPAGERYNKPQNLKAFYEEQSMVADSLDDARLSSNPHVKAYKNAGGGLSGAAAFAGSAVGAKVKTYKDAYNNVKKGLNYVADLAGTAVEAGQAAANGEVLPEQAATQKTDHPASNEKPTTQPRPQADPAKAQEQVVNPKTSPKRAAAIFANQVLANGGRDAMNSPTMQAIYQELMQGNPDAKAAASASLTNATSGNKKAVDAYAKYWDTVRDQIDPHIENHARLSLDGQEGQEGYEQRVKLYESGIRDTLYAVSTQFKNMGYDVSKLSQHPESYRDMVAITAKYYDAKRSAIKHNKNMGWFGSKKELPNMTNFMLKTISVTAPKTAERMALSMAFEQNPDGDSGTIAKEAQTMMQQWSALETFMDEPAE